MYIASMFNRSHTKWLVSYHTPHKIIHEYGFEVEYVAQTATTMHGSLEGHTAYLYKRKSPPSDEVKITTTCFGVPCDPLFEDAWKLCKSGADNVNRHTAALVEEHLAMPARRHTRSKAATMINV